MGNLCVSESIYIKNTNICLDLVFKNSYVSGLCMYLLLYIFFNFNSKATT